MATLVPKPIKTEKKTTNWEKVATIIQLGILIFAIAAMMLSYETTKEANKLSEKSLEVIRQSQDLQNMLYNFPVCVFPNTTSASANMHIISLEDPRYPPTSPGQPIDYSMQGTINVDFTVLSSFDGKLNITLINCDLNYLGQYQATDITSEPTSTIYTVPGVTLYDVHYELPLNGTIGISSYQMEAISVITNASSNKSMILPLNLNFEAKMFEYQPNRNITVSIRYPVSLSLTIS